MFGREKPKSATLAEQEIQSARKMSRRSLLARTGIVAAATAGASAARAGDQKQGDMRDKGPTKIDGSKDTD